MFIFILVTAILTHFVKKDDRLKTEEKKSFWMKMVKYALQLLCKRGTDLRSRMLRPPKLVGRLTDKSIMKRTWDFDHELDEPASKDRQKRAAHSPLNFIIWREQDKNEASPFYQTVRNFKPDEKVEELMRGLVVRTNFQTLFLLIFLRSYSIITTLYLTITDARPQVS